jgi:hypothetical protein
MTAPLHEVLGETQSGRRRSSAKQPNAESLEVFERGPWQAMLRDAKSNGKLPFETFGRPSQRRAGTRVTPSC